jgi:plastocyanin
LAERLIVASPLLGIPEGANEASRHFVITSFEIPMLRHRPFASLLFCLGFAAAPVRAIEVPPPPAPTAPNAVNIGWLVFVPATITVAAGTTVTWTNADDSNHMIKFSDQKSGRLDKGMTYSRSFTAPGNYPYECGIHGARMKGMVEVR